MSIPAWAVGNGKEAEAAIYSRAVALRADSDVLSNYNVCNAWLKEMEAPAAKKPRHQTDCTEEIALKLCAPFDASILSSATDIVHAMQSDLACSIPVARFIQPDSAMSINGGLFVKDYEREAREIAVAFESFENRCLHLNCDRGEKFMLCTYTNITGFLWNQLVSFLPLQPVLSYNYNLRDAGAPDEAIYLNDFMAGKGEFTSRREDLCKAVMEQTKKLASYNHAEYGTRLAYLPVYSAAGTLIEFGIVDAHRKQYIAVKRLSVTDPASRARCLVLAINMFRLIITMAPFIPSNPTPMFRELGNVTFFDSHVVKTVPALGTCPPELYELLETGAVPSAVKVVRRDGKLRMSPTGTRTPNSGKGLTLDEVRSAVRACLTCLAYLHSRGFVHRDVRWPNLIRTFQSGPDGAIQSVAFLIIDFEFSGRVGAPLDIHDYIFADIVPYGEPYTAEHDVQFVGHLIETWSVRNNIVLEGAIAEFAASLQCGALSAEAACAHPWVN